MRQYTHTEMIVAKYNAARGTIARYAHRPNFPLVCSLLFALLRDERVTERTHSVTTSRDIYLKAIGARV
jgi:hypothetical protein